MVESAKKQWYVLHTYSGYENKVKENLESRAQSMGMENNIFRVVVPEEKKEDDKKEETSKKKENLKTFPGYVLVEMVMTDQSWYIVRNTPGVTGFVGSHGAGSKPAPLLDSEIEAILHDMDADNINRDLDLEIGESVKITEGPFSGLIGKITAIDFEKLRLTVDVDMFGRATSTEVATNQVEKLV